MADLAKLVVRLEAESAKLTRELESANRKIGRFEKRTNRSMKRVSKSFDLVKKAALGLGAGLAFRAITRATIEQEQAVAELESRLQSTGGTAGFTSRQLQDMASGLQQVTTYGDEAVIRMQSLLLTFTNLRGPILRDAQEAVLNVATTMGTDLKSAALQVGKALNDPIKGIDGLNRAGIQFTDDQKDVIRSLVETGDTAAAQRLILKELETQFGGSARAARDTFGGALTAVQNAFGDLLEADGGLDDAKKSLNEFADLLQDPAVREGANTLVTGLITGLSTVVQLLTDAASLTRYVAESGAAMFGELAGDDIVRLEDRAELIRDMLESGPLSRVRFFGKDGMVEYYNDDELNAELQKIDAQIQAYYNRRRMPAPPQTGGGSPDSNVNGGSGIAQPDSSSALQERLNDFQTYYNEQALLHAEAQRNLEDQGGIGTTIANLDERAAGSLSDRLNDFQRYYNEQALLLTEAQKNLEDQVSGEALEESTKRTTDAARDLGLTFSSALEDAIVNGENLSDMLQGIEQDILRIITRRLVTEPLADWTTDLIGSMFGGARALGGPVDSGMPYLVGERGPEMFIPATSGRIDPDVGGGGGIQVVQNIYGGTSGVSPKTLQQSAFEAGVAAQRAMRRNG